MSVRTWTGAAWVAAGLLAGCSTAAVAPQSTAPQSTTAATAADTTTGTSVAPVATVAQATTSPTSAPTTTTPAVLGPGCPASGRGAVVDRARQRAWLCDGPWQAGPEIEVTTANSQPLPGTYAIYAKDVVTTSRFGGGLSYLDDFVAFTRGRFTGARIAFHAVPRTAAGQHLQPFDTVGLLERRGDSAGCIRARPDDARRIWDWLSMGDQVTVIS